MADKYTGYSKRVVKDLKRIYKNKSGDEYKMKGDIKNHPCYDILKRDIDKLGEGIKNAPTKVITGAKDMFASLHKPIWKKMIGEYMAKPNDKNTTYTALFTIGIREIIAVVMMIYSFTEATENGLVYTEPKNMSDDEKLRYDFVSKFGKDYDKIAEKWYAQADKKVKKDAPHEPKKSDKEEVTQEAAALSVITGAVDTVVGVVEGVFGILNGLFRTAASLNPVSLISACLSRSYDKKVEQYEKISKEYEAAKKAYDEYKKIPASKRKERIESNYTKMIEKYNIKMKNLKAKIDHYDTRSAKGSEDDDDEETPKSSSTKSSGNKNNTSDKGDKDLPDSSSTVDTSDNKRDDLDF